MLFLCISWAIDLLNSAGSCSSKGDFIVQVATELEGKPCMKHLSDLPDPKQTALDIVTKPDVSGERTESSHNISYA